MARQFDAFGAYTGNSWDSAPDSGKKAAQQTRDVLARVRRVVDPKKMTMYTFWVANAADELKPGTAVYPTADQIRLICQAALQSGITHLDMYGFRIGDYRVTPATLPKLTPGPGPTCPLTAQFPGKFLWDGPQAIGMGSSAAPPLPGRSGRPAHDEFRLKVVVRPFAALEM